MATINPMFSNSMEIEKFFRVELYFPPSPWTMITIPSPSGEISMPILKVQPCNYRWPPLIVNLNIDIYYEICSLRSILYFSSSDSILHNSLYYPRMHQLMAPFPSLPHLFSRFFSVRKFEKISFLFFSPSIDHNSAKYVDQWVIFLYFL